MRDIPACTVRDLLDRQAQAHGERCAIQFVDGEAWSFAELRSRVRTVAAGLQALGVQQGDFVISWQPNGPWAVLTMLALNYLGAVYVPFNTSYRGPILAHVLRNCGARLMIAHGALIGRLAEVERADLRRIVVIGDERPALGGIELVDRSVLRDIARELQEPARPIAPWDTHMVIYTSGTTGPSKGVLCSYLHSYTAASAFRHIEPGDCVYTALPMFHVGGAYGILHALIHGITVVLDAEFRTTEFWDRIDRYRVTTTGLLGAMVGFLLAQPPSAADRTHSLKKALLAPLDANGVKFAERFGVTTYTLFNMSELSVPLFSDPNPDQPGLCGKPRPGVELRIVDEHDMEVPDGAVGELVVRMEQPWTMTHGYLGDAEATARAWRNGWFHTGDLFRRDERGNYFFVDRLKDVVRRRGENISSFEVESALMLHPDVAEAAVVAVRDQIGEEEVLAVVTPVEGRTLDPAELLKFLQPRLPHFMLPRFVRILDRMPKTPTHKIEKHVLRAEGVTEQTWDREAAGLRVRRDALERRE